MKNNRFGYLEYSTNNRIGQEVGSIIQKFPFYIVRPTKIVDIISNQVISNKNSYSTTVLQDKAISEIIKEVQKSKSVNNDKRVNQIRLSMGCFYAALVAILCWFLYSIYVIAS